MNADIKLNNAEYLVDRFLDDIVRLAIVYVRNMDDAEDIAQQTFVAYLHKKPIFVDEDHARRWLFKVTVNNAKCFLRMRRDNVNYDELAGVLFTEDIDYGHIEEEKAVLDAVLQLKPAFREVIHMYYYMDYSLPEIAKILGIPQATAKTRLYRGRRELEKILKGGGHFVEQLQECNE